MRVKYGVYCRQNHGSRDNRYDYVYLVRLSRRSDVTTKHSGDGDGKRLQNNRNRTLVFTTYRYIDYRNQRKAEYGKKYYFSVVGSKNAAQTNGYKKISAVTAAITAKSAYCNLSELQFPVENISYSMSGPPNYLVAYILSVFKRKASI